MSSRAAIATPVLLAVLALSAGCAAPSRPVVPAAINHPVYFKLHDPSRAEELIEDCRRMVERIDVVRAFYVGRHFDTGRAAVDGGYDVGFYVGFNDAAAYTAYIDHPAHVELVHKWRDACQWIRIHDVLHEPGGRP